MKSEKLDNKGNALAPYASPKVKVVTINVQGILCQSGSNEEYTNNNDPNWFGI